MLCKSHRSVPGTHLHSYVRASRSHVVVHLRVSFTHVTTTLGRIIDTIIYLPNLHLITPDWGRGAGENYKHEKKQTDAGDPSAAGPSPRFPPHTLSSFRSSQLSNAKRIPNGTVGFQGGAPDFFGSCGRSWLLDEAIERLPYFAGILVS